MTASGVSSFVKYTFAFSTIWFSSFLEMEDVVLIILHGADFKSRGKIRNFLLPGMSKIDDLLEFVLAEE